MRRKFFARHDGGRPAAVVYCVCAVYLYCVGSLLAWASLPVVTGMTPTLILSGSMGPAITAGDVVMVGSPAGHTIQRGHVITFDDPAHPGRLLTHRVAAINGDGTLRTRGDANAHPDSTRVPPDAVHGVGKILVPAVGVPLMWIRTQSWLNLLLWIGGSFLALGYLRAYGHRLPLVSRWSTPLTLPPAEPRSVRTRAQPTWERPVPARLKTRWVVPVIVMLALVGAALPRLVNSHAAFSAATSSTTNAWSAGSTFCPNPGVYTLNPAADRSVAQDGTTISGTATTLTVVGRANSKNVRALMRFTLPPAAECVVSAVLRVNVSATSNGRSLQVANANEAWSEASATWAAAAHSPAVAPTQLLSAQGWLEFPVTAHVDALYAGTNNGFVLNDSVENAGNNSITLHSREAATLRPELLLTLSDVPPPAAPSGLEASALSSTRIELSWTDTSGGVAGFRVERSPGGAGSWSTVDTVAAGTTSYTDTGLTAETAYDYRVRATGTGGVSTPSNVASATTPAPPAPPASPTSAAATATGVTTVGVTWTDASTDEDGFTVQRSAAGAGTWADAGTVGPNVTSFGDTGLTAGTAYDYRVRAYNGGGTSSWSNVATVTTDGCSTLPAQTLLSEADALILEGATYGGMNFGADAVNFGVRSMAGANGRSLVRFPSPTVAAGCSVATANLRLRTTSTTTDRTLQVFNADAAWIETTVTWNTRPTSSGTAATVTTDGVLGWRQWDVTGLVGAAGTGAPHGFMLRDANEGNATAVDNVFSPKEGTYRPELVITFG